MEHFTKAGGLALFIVFVFFFNDTATTEIYTLSLHDALPIYYNTYSPALAAHRIKAIFKNEPGEGSGVARSFYTAFSQVSQIGRAHV